MYSTLLVPLDGSPEAELSLPSVASLTLANPQGARVVLVRSAAEPEPQQGMPIGPAQVRALEEAESYLRSVAMRLTRAGVDVSATTGAGDFVDVIDSQVQTENADVIVMATHGRWGVDRLVHGSLAESVLARAERPVLLFGPGAASGTRFERMLIPLDGGPFSAAVLPAAAGFARSFGIKHIDLLAILPTQSVHVDELDGAPPTWALEKMGIVDVGQGTYALHASQPIVSQRVQELQHALEYWSEWLGESGAEVHAHVRYDIGLSGTAQSTLAVATELKADLIVMRTHARRGFARAITGSVADEVVRASRLPVLLYTTRALESLASAVPSTQIQIQIDS